MLSTSFETLKNPRFQARGFFSSRGVTSALTQRLLILSRYSRLSTKCRPQPSNAVASQDQQRWKFTLAALREGFDLLFDAKSFQRQVVVEQGVGLVGLGTRHNQLS